MALEKIALEDPYFIQRKRQNMRTPAALQATCTRSLPCSRFAPFVLLCHTRPGSSLPVYPNVDFYSGLIYKAMGFPTDYFPVLFLIPRTVGWLAHWSEFIDDPENRIVRPFQVYVGSGKRDYQGLDSRQDAEKQMEIHSEATAESRRRNAAKSDSSYSSNL